MHEYQYWCDLAIAGRLWREVLQVWPSVLVCDGMGCHVSGGRGGLGLAVVAASAEGGAEIVPAGRGMREATDERARTPSRAQ